MRHRAHLLRLSAAVTGMFAFGFALVPLYGMICEATGWNGRMKLEAAQAQVLPVDRSRLVKVEFVTTVSGSEPWQFAARTPSVLVHPGEPATVSFWAQNGSDGARTAQAVPNIAPWNAAAHLRKTECFCFRPQVFAAGEGREMPVRFVIDPELPAGVDTVTLSYTFFETTPAATAAASASGGPG